jgi:predicted DNA-binding transcriptional regulator YafY
VTAAPHGRVTSMLTSGAHAERRLRMLKSALAEKGALSVAEAAALTGASTATAARDLSLLAETVGAQRVRGGVVADEQVTPGFDPTLESVVGNTDDVDLVRLSVNHAEQATWSLQAGDVAAAEVHARLAQAMATLSTARRPDAV